MLRLLLSRPPDLVILDLGLPDLDGQEVLRRLREWYPSSIIVLSARDQEGVEVHLTPIEYKLFVTMIKHAGKVLTHRFLLREVWGPQDSHENHYLRVFVASLRRKLEDDPARPRYLLTDQGIGYRFASE